jgi:SAM-dependent methyltransferase
MSSEQAPSAAHDAFEIRYRTARDPWNFAHSPYERGRYRDTLDGLSRSRYRSAYEPGCSIGELTAQLALRCDRVQATDISPTAVSRARQRCAQFRNVSIACADVSDDIAGGPFDLIVFSEIGYYFSRGQLSGIARRLSRTMEPDGEFVAVHWLGDSIDHVLHGDDVHEVLEQSLGLAPATRRRAPGYRIDSWVRR